MTEAITQKDNDQAALLKRLSPKAAKLLLYLLATGKSHLTAREAAAELGEGFKDEKTFYRARDELIAWGVWDNGSPAKAGWLHERMVQPVEAARAQATEERDAARLELQRKCEQHWQEDRRLRVLLMEAQRDQDHWQRQTEVLSWQLHAHATPREEMPALFEAFVTLLPTAEDIEEAYHQRLEHDHPLRRSDPGERGDPGDRERLSAAKARLLDWLDGKKSRKQAS